MPRSSGTYSLPAGNPVVTNTTISSTAFNNTMNDLGAALTQSISQDGQTPITANLPMTGFKHTGVAAATALTDYLRADQGQNSSLQWLTAVAGTDTITASLATPNLTAYAAGQTFRFIPAGTNATTAVTLNINSIGAKNVYADGAAVLVGAIPSGAVVEVVYDGTQFELSGVYGAGNLTGAMNWAATVTIASSATVNIGAAASNAIIISGTTTITAFDTIAAGVMRWVKFSGALTLTYNATSLLLPGAANITTATNDEAVFISLGSGNWKCIAYYPYAGIVLLSGNQTIAGVKTFSSQPNFPAQSMVQLNTANGYGSTNTMIRRFTNTVTNQGSDITYADSATNGATFTINTNGVYAISYTDNFSVSDQLGISLNSNQLTTGIGSITITNSLGAVTTSAANSQNTHSVTTYLAAGSVIRAHTGGSGTGSNRTFFTITRVS